MQHPIKLFERKSEKTRLQENFQLILQTTVPLLRHRYLHRMGSVLASGFFPGIGAEPVRFRSEGVRVGAKGGRK